MDRLFPYFSDYDEIDIYQIIWDKIISPNQREIAFHVQDEIETLLYEKFKYAEKTNRNNYNGCLTPLGREVKAAGGHIAYINKSAKEKEANLLRQGLNDKKLLQDIINAEFEGNQGRKIKRGSYRIAIASFILSIVLAIPGSILLNQFFYPNSGNEASVDSIKKELVQTKQQLQDLKLMIQKDTTIKK